MIQEITKNLMGPTNHVEIKLNPTETQLLISQLLYTTDTAVNTARRSYKNTPPVENVSFKEIVSGPLSSKFIKEYSKLHYIKYREAYSSDGVWKVVLVCALDSPDNLNRTDHNSPKVITAFISKRQNFEEMQIDEDQSTTPSRKLTTDISITIFNNSDYIGHYKNVTLLWDGQAGTVAIQLDVIYLVEWLEFKPGSSAIIRFDIKSTHTVELIKAFPFEKLPTDVYMTIIDSLSLPDVSNLCSAIPTLSNISSEVARKRLEILLSPYFPSISDFVTILDKTGAIIGGSGILHVLKPGDWIPTDIDIIVPLLGEVTMIKFLESLDYCQDKKKSVLGYGGRGQVGFKYHHFTKGNNRIDICSTVYLTPGDFVLTYHSTPPMNYYDGHNLISLFPNFTFNHISVKNRFTLTDRLVHGLEKYYKRGYKPYFTVEHIQELPNLIHRKRRQVSYGNIVGLMSIEDQISVEMIQKKWEFEVDLVEDEEVKRRYPQYLLDSVARLEKLTDEVEEKGSDSGGTYRRATRVIVENLTGMSLHERGLIIREERTARAGGAHFPEETYPEPEVRWMRVPAS